MSAIARSGTQLYRDCLRLVKHVAGESPKAVALRGVVRQQFEQSREETDEAVLEDMKADAVRALSNYMLYSAAKQDPKMRKSLESTNDSIAKTLAAMGRGQQ